MRSVELWATNLAKLIQFAFGLSKKLMMVGWLIMPLTGLAQQCIRIKLAENLTGPYTGRLMVYVQADTSKPFTMSNEAAAFAIEVKDWKYGEIKKIDHTSFSYHASLDSLKGFYKMVAILDTSVKERGINAPGNLFTKQEAIGHFDHGTLESPLLTLTNVFPERKFKEDANTKEMIFRSTLLTAFRKEAIFIRAGIVLPPSYHLDSNRKYPTVYVIPGWGGTHHHAYNKGQQQLYGVHRGEEKIYVFLNPETQTPFGLHAFIDSRINGPWGTALVKEFIPELESRFRVIKEPGQRLITGQSSGGYGALWLALHFPSDFAGCWATSPDPIDFSNFTGVDIYHDKNYFQDIHHKERGIAFEKGNSRSTLRMMFAKEQLEGDGGQQQSFEAAFGLPDRSGRPSKLFDPNTGKINSAVARSWQPYDLARYVRKHWSRIRRHAAGKIRIYVGAHDNFLLQHSALAFEQKIKTVGAAIQVQLVTEADHFTTRQLVADIIQKEMDATLRRIP